MIQQVTMTSTSPETASQTKKTKGDDTDFLSLMTANTSKLSEASVKSTKKSKSSETGTDIDTGSDSNSESGTGTALSTDIPTDGIALTGLVIIPFTAWQSAGSANGVSSDEAPISKETVLLPVTGSESNTKSTVVLQSSLNLNVSNEAVVSNLAASDSNQATKQEGAQNTVAVVAAAESPALSTVIENIGATVTTATNTETVATEVSQTATTLTTATTAFNFSTATSTTTTPSASSLSAETASVPFSVSEMPAITAPSSQESAGIMQTQDTGQARQSLTTVISSSSTSNGQEQNTAASDSKQDSQTGYEGNTVSMNAVPVSELLNSGNVVVKVSDEASLVNKSVMTQVTDQIAANYNADNSEFEVELYPESLGKVSVKLSIVDDVLTVSIVADNAKSQSLLMSHSEQIQSILQDSVNHSVQVVDSSQSKQWYDQDTSSNQSQQQQQQNPEQNDKSDSQSDINTEDFLSLMQFLQLNMV